MCYEDICPTCKREFLNSTVDTSVGCAECVQRRRMSFVWFLRHHLDGTDWLLRLSMRITDAELEAYANMPTGFEQDCRLEELAHIVFDKKVFKEDALESLMNIQDI